MVANMVFHHLRHEPIERTPAGRDLLQNRRALGLRLHGTLDGLQLATDASDSCEQLFLLCLGVSH